MNRLLILLIVSSCSTIDVVQNYAKGSFWIQQKEFTVLSNLKREQVFTAKIISTSYTNIETQIEVQSNSCKGFINIATNTCEQFSKDQSCAIVFTVSEGVVMNSKCDITINSPNQYSSKITLSPKS